MNIELSGKNKTVADGITVAELIAQEQLETCLLYTSDAADE